MKLAAAIDRGFGARDRGRRRLSVTGRGGRGPVSVRRAVAQFVLASLAAVALIGFVGVQILMGESRREATADAKELVRLAGRGIVEPELSNGVLTGNRAAIARLDRIVRRSVLGQGIVRVKIRSAQGRVVYSDLPQLIGSREPLSKLEVRALRSRNIIAERSGAATYAELSLRHLLEVYLPIHTPDGHPLLFEGFLPSTEVSASARRLWTAFVPALLGGLVLLGLVQIPLAWSLATRLRRRQEERAMLLEQAIAASRMSVGESRGICTTGPCRSWPASRIRSPRRPTP